MNKQAYMRMMKVASLLKSSEKTEAEARTFLDDIEQRTNKPYQEFLKQPAYSGALPYSYVDPNEPRHDLLRYTELGDTPKFFRVFLDTLKRIPRKDRSPIFEAMDKYLSNPDRINKYNIKPGASLGTFKEQYPLFY